MEQIKKFSKTLQSVLQRKKEKDFELWKQKTEKRFNMVSIMLQDLQERQNSNEMVFVVGFKRYDNYGN